MTNLVQELNSLDFSVYIGGPMQAAIQAQHAASMSQVSFIKEVGFENTPAGTLGELRYVDFKHKKSVPNPNIGKAPAVRSKFLQRPELTFSKLREFATAS